MIEGDLKVANSHLRIFVLMLVMTLYYSYSDGVNLVLEPG